jgi:purine-binding chemotaxis protein CheW
VSIPTISSSVSREYLSFKVGGHEYIIDVMFVDRVLTYAKYIQRPHSNPLVELRKKRGSCGAKHGGPAIVISLRGDDGLSGLLVHQVNDILEIAPEQLLAVPESPPVDPDVLLGQVVLETRELLLLDVDKLLAMRLNYLTKHASKVPVNKSVELLHLPSSPVSATSELTE